MDCRPPPADISNQLPIPTPLMRIFHAKQEGTIMRNLLIVLLAICMPSIARAAELSLTVSAGDSDRTSTPLAFDLPDNFPAGNWYLSSENQPYIPLHISGKT